MLNPVIEGTSTKMEVVLQVLGSVGILALALCLAL